MDIGVNCKLDGFVVDSAEVVVVHVRHLMRLVE